MNKVEFIQKYENKISSLKQIRSNFRDICNRTKKSTKEYKNAWGGVSDTTYTISLLERMLEDFKNIK